LKFEWEGRKRQARWLIGLLFSDS